MGDAVNTAFRFGEFELDRDRRVLLKNRESVPLKPKTFDLLLTLVQNRGSVLTKSELLDNVWENQFVEENNLTVHVAALRKVLGETSKDNRFIVTVPGKGYKFVADLDPPTNGAIFIEKHRRQRITVDEEIVETAPALDRPVRATWTYGNRFATSVLLIAAAAIVAGGFALRTQFGHAATPAFTRHTLRQLTTSGNIGKASISPDGRMFAYTTDTLGRKVLYVGSTDGGNHIELQPSTEAVYGTLLFTPDNSRLLFARRSADDANFDLYSIPAFGGVASKLMDGVREFALSSDGRQIVTARRVEDRDLLEVGPLDGGERREVVSFPKENSFVFASPSFSNDGKRLALSVDRGEPLYTQELGIVDIAAGTLTRVPVSGVRDIAKTVWLADDSGLVITAIEDGAYSSVPQYRLFHVALPNGKASLITTDRSNYGASWHNDAGVSLSLSADMSRLLAVEHRQLSNVWVAAADNLADSRQITFSSFGKYDGLWGLDWAPDGSIVYTTSDTRSQFLSRMNGDGSGQRQISASGSIDSVLTVSADGRYVLFHSSRAGGFDIWRADIDGTNAKQLTFGGKGFHPAPSPDGKWVYYKSYLDRPGVLCRVPIDGGEPEILTDKETSWMSFSPDGAYFAASYITDKQRLAIFSAETNQIVKQFELPKGGTLYMGSRWTPDSKAVAFRDNTHGYWIQPVDGTAPRRLEGLPKEKLYNFSWSHDGAWLAYVRGQEIRDVVLLVNSNE